jgi:hypothetical protein
MRPEHWLYTIPLRLRSLFRWAQADQELDEELRDHLERKTEEYVAQGMTQEEARRRARVDLRGHCGFAAGNQSLKFKVDENLPTEYASILRGAGFEADTVSDEKLSGASDSVLSPAFAGGLVLPRIAGLEPHQRQRLLRAHAAAALRQASDRICPLPERSPEKS